jgi:hypothetical protein
METANYTIQGPVVITPDKFQIASTLAIRRNNKIGRTELIVSDNYGNSYTVLLPQPTTANTPGSILQLDQGLNAVWAPLPEVQSETTTATNNPVTIEKSISYVDIPFFGILSSSRTFGFFRAPSSSSVSIIGTQISIQDPPVGNSVIVDIVDAQTGASLGKQSIITDGYSTSQSIFSQPLVIPVGQSIKCQILQVGSINPGDSMNLRLIILNN